jgi:hypothetical protein
MGARDLGPLEYAAFALDEALSRAARSLGLFDLALGQTLASLFDRGLLCQLAYARESDYARERLGLPPSTMHECVRLARELAHRPVLRQAVAAGLVSTRKALAVMPLAVGDYEGAWTEAALRLSLREIASAVKAAGKESPEERFEAEAVVLPMTPEQQDRLDAALSIAKQEIGPEARRWQCMEAISQEFLSSFAEWDREGGAGGLPASAGAAPLSPAAARLVARQLVALDEALDVIRGIGAEHPGEDALALDARARRLVAARRRYDETLGILAKRMRDGRLHTVLGYGFDAYCEERLGMRAGAVRQRIWLEGRMRDLPALRQALWSGRLSYTKARVVARRATWADVDERIARAAGTTCQQTEREDEEEEARESRAKGTRRLWSPGDAAQTVRDAIATAQARSLAERGLAIDAGEALALIADHFVEVAEANWPERTRRSREEQRRRVLMRKGGLCAVPGCSREAAHVHHIVFRSRGGAPIPQNEIGLCAVHHLRGVHMGHLEVAGRAGERLRWRFGTGEAVPTEEWVTLGDDDVRRAASAAGGVTDAESAPPDVTDVESGGGSVADAEFGGGGGVTDAESGGAGGVHDADRRGGVTDAGPAGRDAARRDGVMEADGAGFVAEAGSSGDGGILSRDAA